MRKKCICALYYQSVLSESVSTSEFAEVSKTYNHFSASQGYRFDEERKKNVV